MPKLTTIIVPTVTGTRAMTGYVANIPLNIGRADLPDAPTVKFLIDESNWNGQLKADFEDTVLPYLEKLGAKSIGTLGTFR